MYQIDKLARLLSFFSLCNCIYIYTFIREKNRQRPPRSDERKRLYIYIYIHIFIYKREEGMNTGELRLVPTLSILSNIYIWEFLENTEREGGGRRYWEKGGTQSVSNRHF